MSGDFKQHGFMPSPLGRLTPERTHLSHILFRLRRAWLIKSNPRCQCLSLGNRSDRKERKYFVARFCCRFRNGLTSQSDWELIDGFPSRLDNSWRRACSVPRPDDPESVLADSDPLGAGAEADANRLAGSCCVNCVKGANIGVTSPVGEGWEDRRHGLLLPLSQSSGSARCVAV